MQNFAFWKTWHQSKQFWETGHHLQNAKLYIYREILFLRYLKEFVVSLSMPGIYQCKINTCNWSVNLLLSYLVSMYMHKTLVLIKFSLHSSLFHNRTEWFVKFGGVLHRNLNLPRSSQVLMRSSVQYSHYFKNIF